MMLHSCGVDLCIVVPKHPYQPTPLCLQKLQFFKGALLPLGLHQECKIGKQVCMCAHAVHLVNAVHNAPGLMV